MFHVEQVGLIRDACISYGIPFSQEVLERFQRYRSSLIEWNKKINLISVNDEPRIVTRHFLQSIGLLRVFDFPIGCRVLDLGTGGGFPGIPIKIIRPDLEMVLVEATQKKVLFLMELIRILGLTNVVALPVRIESIGGKIKPVDIVISRAVTDMRNLVRWSRSCMKKDGGYLLAIKGKRLEREVADLETDRRFSSSVSLKVIPYNPFPEQFVLNDSYVAVANIIKNK
jgi:16S rRNA (guanine527-N7)-methyltransferase